MITLHTGNLTPEIIQNTSFITSNIEPESLFEIINMMLDNSLINIDSDENDDFIVNDVNISCFCASFYLSRSFILFSNVAILSRIPFMTELSPFNQPKTMIKKDLSWKKFKNNLC
jgi:hypothetical protein